MGTAKKRDSGSQSKDTASRPAIRFTDDLDIPDPLIEKNDQSRSDALSSGVAGLSKKLEVNSPSKEAKDQARIEIRALERLLDLSRQLSSSLDHATLLERTLDAVMSLEIADRGLIVLRLGNELRVVCERNRVGQTLPSEESRISETLAKKCIEANRLQVYDNLVDIPELRDTASITELSLKSAICVPLREKGQPIGVLYLDSSSMLFLESNSHSKLLEAFAAHASVLLVYARAVEVELEKRRLLSRKNEDLRAEVVGGWRIDGLIGESPPWIHILEQVRVIKDVDNPALIIGESGTGKEEIARALHYEGRRAQTGDFVAFNCAAVPEGLMESELFGVRRGAYTSAHEDRPGIVEQADLGTLFLDEIGDMPVVLQAKLLRFLDSGRFNRVGEPGFERQVNVRIVSASNRDLTELMQAQRFREDLYFRVKGVQIHLPPLRERREDIPLLIDHFLRRSREQFDPKKIGEFTDQAQRLLYACPWPGNVRELMRAVENACAFVPDGKRPDLPHLVPHLNLVEDLATYLDRVETLRQAKRRVEGECLRVALRRHDWDHKATGRDLGVTRQHVHNLVRKHALKRPTDE